LYLRECVVAAIGDGQSRSRGVFSRPSGGRRPFVMVGEADWLKTRLTEKPDIMLRELRSELHGRGIEVSYYGVWNITIRLDQSFTKRLHAQANRAASTSPARGTVEATAKER
jgi:transposase